MSHDKDADRLQVDHLAALIFPGVLSFYGEMYGDTWLVKRSYALAESLYLEQLTRFEAQTHGETK